MNRGSAFLPEEVLRIDAACVTAHEGFVHSMIPLGAMAQEVLFGVAHSLW